MDVSIVVASIAGTVALASAMLATTQATKARKSGRTEQLEAKLDQLTADRHLLYLWNRQLVDHIYRGIGPPPPQPPHNPPPDSSQTTKKEPPCLSTPPPSASTSTSSASPHSRSPPSSPSGNPRSPPLSATAQTSSAPPHSAPP